MRKGVKKMNIESYKNRGYVGLCNLGNTCFLNSCVQILNHTYELVELMKSDKIGASGIMKDGTDSVILKEWFELCNLMWNCNEPCSVSPKKFVFEVHHVARLKGRDLFTGWGQNDITEFLLFMVDCMHNSISRNIDVCIRGKPKHSTDKTAIQCYKMLKSVYEKEYSEIMDMFYGIYISEIVSLNNPKKIHSSKPEHFFVLDIPIPTQEPSPSQKSITLYDCFNMFVSSEQMTGDNAWFNEKTGKKENVEKKISFWSFPKIIVIALKRFSHDGMHKINSLVDFPLEKLDLKDYVKGYNPEKYMYNLYGVCNHIGSVNGGHYTAFVRNANDEWIHYNDTNVQKINEKNVVSPMAYCLFYRQTSI
jgi:ubiquitin C-terminal hydrolase